MSKRCSSVTVSLIPFLSIDIQPVSFVIYARFLYHYPITGNLDRKQKLRLYTSVQQRITNNKSNKYPIPILINHLIILCKNGYKIGETGWFSLLGKALQLPDTPMLPPFTPGCIGSLHPDVKDGNMGVFTELSACFC